MLLTPFRYIFCILWSILMISSSIILMILLFRPKLPIVMARTMWSPGILWACGVRLKVKQTEKLDPADSYIFVSNHMSYLDIPSLFRGIPYNLYFIAKKEIKWVPFIGQYMMATGMIFIDRTNRNRAMESLKRAGELIRKGKNVLMFPEGTRSKDQDQQLGEFKKGPFHLASRADVKVVPVAITGTDRVLPAGSFAVKPGLVHISIGTAIDPNSFANLQQFIDEASAQMTTLLNQPH